MIFAVKRPLCYCPAYIVNISHIPNDKKGNWYERISDDKDVSGTVSKMLDDISNRITDLGWLEISLLSNCYFLTIKIYYYLLLGAAHSRRNVPYYLHRTHDGVKADLTAVTKLMLLSTKFT